MFFDRYLKGIRNGWEDTPRVRIDVMDAYDFDNQLRRARERVPAGPDRVQEALSRRGQPLAVHDPGDDGSRSATTTPTKEQGDVRHHLRRGDRAHRLHEAAPVGGGRRQRRHGPVRRRPEAGRQGQVAALPTYWASLIPAARASSASPCARSTRSIRITASSSRGIPSRTRRSSSRARSCRWRSRSIPRAAIWHSGRAAAAWRSWATTSASTGSSLSPGTPTTRALTSSTSGGKYDSYLLVPYIPPKYVAGNTVYR